MTAVTDVWCPWRHLEHHWPDVLVHRCQLPDGKAWWCPETRVILLADHLSAGEQRVSLAHELGHLELGHTADDGMDALVREAAADAWAAERLRGLPSPAGVGEDPTMASRECWFCKRLSHLSQYGDSVSLGRPLPAHQNLEFRQAAFLCDNCTRMSIGLATINHHRDRWEPGRGDLDGREIEMWQPAHATGQEFPDVPGPIGAAANEAHECRSIGAFRAAVLLARSVIEASAKDKGITKGQLMGKIDDMSAQGFIRPQVAEAAHTVRDLGNDMAHGDFADEVTAEDAEDVLVIMAEVLGEVYQAPSRVARLRSRTAARGTGTAAGE